MCPSLEPVIFDDEYPCYMGKKSTVKFELESQTQKFPEGHGGVHQPDEKLNIDGFLGAIKILVCMIMEIDAYLNVG